MTLHNKYNFSRKYLRRNTGGSNYIYHCKSVIFLKAINELDNYVVFLV